MLEFNNYSDNSKEICRFTETNIVMYDKEVCNDPYICGLYLKDLNKHIRLDDEEIHVHVNDITDKEANITFNIDGKDMLVLKLDHAIIDGEEVRGEELPERAFNALGRWLMLMQGNKD